MSLPQIDDKAAMRALDRKCAVPDSVVSKRTVRQLAALPLECKERFLKNFIVAGLGNLVRCALEAGVSPDTTGGEETGSLPVLLLAAQFGLTHALKALLTGGANIELANDGGFTALAVAARLGHPSCAQALLDAGANANTQGRSGHTPLMEAVMHKQVDCVRALLAASNLAVTDKMGNTAFHAAVITASEACFELLLPLYDVDVRTVPGVQPSGKAMPFFNMTALHLACQRGLLAMCKTLLGHGADRMARDSRQFTPLHYAAGQGNLSCVVMLVGRPGKVRMTPAEVDAADENGRTALHYAALHGSDQICGVLLGAGAQLDAKDSHGQTPLMIAQALHPTNAALLALLSGDAPEQLFGLVCDHCGKTAEEASVRSLKDCGKCYVARYCGKECQLAAWPEHKVACKAKVKEREERTRPIALADSLCAERPGASGRTAASTSVEAHEGSHPFMPSMSRSYHSRSQKTISRKKTGAGPPSTGHREVRIPSVMRGSLRGATTARR
jgi:ankyrin repeat protein